MNMNIISCIFIIFAMFMGGVGLLINYIEPYLPEIVSHIYRYGKLHTKTRRPIAMKFEIPKNWFRHFYIFAGLTSSLILCLVFYKYLYNGNIPEMTFTLLDILFGASRKSLVSAENAILAIIVLNIHCWKRVYETFCVSVFSDQKINIAHYLVGYIHYLGTLLCVIGESEEFVKDRIFYAGSRAHVSWDKLINVKLICAFIFVYLSYLQLRSNFILAKLRKTKDGTVTTYAYKIPIGELFEYITNPLQFTEIFMYLMLSVILWQSTTYHYITLWVIVNQTECAYLSQQWYYNTFKNYPKNRKILIPYIW